MKLTSGTELDWERVEDAATRIAKHAELASFCPPEAMDLHHQRAVAICEELSIISRALYLEAQVPQDALTLPAERVTDEYATAERMMEAWAKRAELLKTRLGGGR